MICPATKAECHMAESCKERGCGAVIDPRCGMTVDPPPKPTMADIERLVDALIYDSCNASLPEGEAARAALLAAIQAYGSDK